MQYKRYGKTNLDISVLTFGAMRIPFDDDSCSAAERDAGEANAIATIRRAMELGINHIDTARGYLNSERLIGMALKELGRDKFFISTKIGVQPSYDKAAKMIDEALANMGTDHIEVVDLHGINTEEKFKTATDPNGCMKAVLDAVADGRVGSLAFSTHARSDLIIKTMELGMFDAVSLHHYQTYPFNSEAISRAQELDIGTLLLSPAEKGGFLYRPTLELEEVCSPYTPLGFMHRWSWAHEGVTTLTVGAANPEELEAHIPGGEGPAEFTDEEEAVLARYHAKLREVLGDTLCTLCDKCMPCPKEVAIPDILRFRNISMAFGMDDFARWRYNMLEESGEWFPGTKGHRCNKCGDCLPRCPENLDIPALLKETHKLLSGKPGKRLWSFR